MNEAKEILDALPKSREYYTTVRSAELARLRKIAACFEKGDATAIQEFGTLLHAQCAQVFPAQWALLNRCQAAAKLAEDSCK